MLLIFSMKRLSFWLKTICLFNFLNMKKIGLFLLFIFVGQLLPAQEFIFNVSINTPQLTKVDPKVFETLEASLSDFLNNQKWTNDVFEVEERIKCNIQMTIRDEISLTKFKADLAIQAVRPVYGSNYETPIFTHVDKDVVFNYEAFQPIQFSQNVFLDNLSSIISFYVHIILGYDYDTFSLYGGDQYFQVAQDILTAVPPNKASEFKGWRALDGNRNRYFIINNLTSPGLKIFRKGMYNYHRLGLDMMHKEPNTGKVIINQVLDDIAKANKNYPNSMVVRLFIVSKADEVLEIFKESTPTQKTSVRETLSKLDASNASKYRRALGR